jgi:outer membrane protein TolC
LDAARGAERTAEHEQERTVQEAAMSVRQAYFGTLKALGLRSVAEKNLEQAKAHLAQAEAFFRAGSRPRFDVTRTEVEVNSAQLSLINAANGVRVSRLTLGNAMGVQLPDDIEIEDVPLALVDAPDLATAQRDALRNRPEMLKAAAEVEAAESRLNAERSQYLPNISAGGSYSWASGTATMGPYRSDLDSSWNAGVTLNVSLFEGGVTRGRIAEARAGLKISEARREVLAQGTILEVNQAHADLENAEARLTVMESSLRKAKENREIAQGRYQAGVGPYIEVTDASLSELNAEIDFVQAR